MYKQNNSSSGTLPSGKQITGATMNAFRKLKTLALFAGAIFMSAPPAHAEDIEIYLYQNEGSGANILLLIDNSGATNRNFPGTSGIPTAEQPSPLKTIDEITYALTQTIPAISGNSRLGVAAQLAGGDNGGAIYYPVKQIDETVSPSGYADVTRLDGEVGQTFNLGGAVLPQDTSAGTWTNFLKGEAKLEFPSMMSSSADRKVLAVTLSGLGVPRYAQIDSAILSFSSPTANSGARDKFEARVAYEVNGTPADLTDISSLIWSEKLDTGYNAVGGLSDGIIRIDVTNVIQQAIASPMWCGNRDIRLLIMASSLSTSNVPWIYTSNAPEGKTELNVNWNASGAVTPPSVITGDDRLSCIEGLNLNMGSRNDDATETTTGSNLQLTNEELLLKNVTSGPSSERGQYIAGARFSSLAFGNGTKVSNAKLHGNLSSSVGSPTVSIRGLTADVQEFTNDGDITKYSTGTEVATLDSATGFPVDITNVLNEMFNADTNGDGTGDGYAGWASGHSLGLRLDLASGSSAGIASVDSGATSGLRITMDVLAKTPQEFGASFNRASDMQLAVKQFANNNGGGNNKPVSSYVEAAEYMLGNDAVFGNAFSHIDAFETPRVNYLSPSEEYESCGGNHIIMVTCRVFRRILRQ